MPAPSRDEAIRTLQEGGALLQALQSRLGAEELTRPATIGGGDWSAKDLLGHIATWEEIALEALAEWRRGERPAIESVFDEDDGVDRLNAEAIAAKAAASPDHIRDAATEIHRALLDAIRATSDEAWAARAPYPAERRRTLGHLLGSVLGAPKRPFGHAFAHLPDLEAYVASLDTDA